jgi:hypothetical protein
MLIFWRLTLLVPDMPFEIIQAVMICLSARQHYVLLVFSNASDCLSYYLSNCLSKPTLASLAQILATSSKKYK